MRLPVVLTILLLLEVPGARLENQAFCGDTDRQCGQQPAPAHVRALSDIGGRYITAHGTLRVLLVFASFPDDETAHPYWPAHQPPLFMRQFIDPDTVAKSTDQFNLTNYFREMSLGQFHLIGDVVWVESGHSQSEYRNWPYGRANRDLIIECLDSLVDFSQYDHWTRGEDYSIVEAPDSVVDMIIMVWRTTMYEYLGEASLGYLARIPADGKYIYMGYPERFDMPQGSGITCEYPYTDSPVLLRKTIAHELGHWLLGGSHPYSQQLAGKHQFWGLLCAGKRISACMNSYERECLGWITVPTMAADSSYTLRDYVQTGDALKYHPPNGDDYEYFYIENHQFLSALDDATLNTGDKGIWILHQQHPYSNLDDLRIRPADGNWDWIETPMTSACFGNSVPVFARGEPRVLTGPSHRDQIPTPASSVNWMYAMKDDSGSLRCAAFLGGEGLSGAFDSAGTGVFSPYSNPCSDTWANGPTSFAFEVATGTHGARTVHRYVNPLDAPPARRYLGLNPSSSGSSGGGLSLAWGAQWREGQPLEIDVTASTLQRKIADGDWVTLYDGPATSWADQSIHYDSSGQNTVAFRVRVSDSQGKKSAWSNILRARTSGTMAVSGNLRSDSFQSRLEQPYPNPCNPVTQIGYSIGVASRQSPAPRGMAGSVASFVRLSVFDVLGREVAVLVNERKEPGTYSVRFDGRNLPSGLYVCRLSSGGFSQTRKIVIVR